MDKKGKDGKIVEIFIDTANLNEINRWVGMGIVDGVTTNPSIMRQDGVTDFEKRAKSIATMISPRPVSVEVTADDYYAMREQALMFAKWADNIVVKVPQITRQGEPCYGVIRGLEQEGVRVNATVALSMGQMILSAKAGATYISLFAGRISDEGNNAREVMTNSAEWLKWWGYGNKIIAGSIRSVGDVLDAANSGVHVVTIPPKILEKMADHKYTRFTVEQFIGDAEAAMKDAEIAKQ